MACCVARRHGAARCRASRGARLGIPARARRLSRTCLQRAQSMVGCVRVRIHSTRLAALNTSSTPAHAAATLPGACLHRETQAVLAHYGGEVVCRRDGAVVCTFPSLAASAAARAAAGGGGGDAVGALAVVPGELRGRGQLVEREATFTRASPAQQRLALGLAAANLAMAALLVPLALAYRPPPCPPASPHSRAPFAHSHRGRPSFLSASRHHPPQVVLLSTVTDIEELTVTQRLTAF